MFSAVGQHAENVNSEQHKETHEEEFKKYKVALALGMTNIPSGFEEGDEEKSVFVPSIGFDFFYYLNHKWSLGFVADLELSEYLVSFNREPLNREKAFILALLASYEIQPGWGILVGGGIELEKHKNLGVVRLGTEYEFDLGNEWSLAPSLFWDIK